MVTLVFLTPVVSLWMVTLVFLTPVVGLWMVTLFFLTPFGGLDGHPCLPNTCSGLNLT